MMQSKSNTKEALDDFQLAISLKPPKDQRAVLTKKVIECQRKLASMKDRHSTSTNTSGEKKIRSHDASALAF